MANLLKSPNQFTHEIFGSLTTITNDQGEVYFIGKEICEKLGYTNPSKAISDHVREKYRLELDNVSLLSLGVDLGQRGGVLISEPGMYSLIMRSKLDIAEKFQDWVTEEVLPSIRKTGSYGVQLPNFNDPYEAAIAWANEYKAKTEAINALNAAKYKIDHFDRLIDRELNVNLRTTAKEIGVGERRFISMLQVNGFLYRDAAQRLTPYAHAVKDGLFVVKEWANERRAGVQVLVTPKGRLVFSKMMDKMWSTGDEDIR
jgi:prophage antirepressor-like protein